MSRIPPESHSWTEPSDPDAVAQDLREQLAHAKARMQEHRDQMHAAGLTTHEDPDAPGASGA